MSGNTPSDFERFIANSTEPLFSIVVDIETDADQATDELPAGLSEIFEDPKIAGILHSNNTENTVANRISPNLTRLVLHANNEDDADSLKRFIENKSQPNVSDRTKRGKKPKYSVKTELNLVRVPEFITSEIYVVEPELGRNLGAAQVGSIAFRAVGGTAPVNIRDTQMGRTDWATLVLDALGDAKPVATLGVLDTGIAAAHSFFSDVKMTRYDCANGIECSYTNFGNPIGDDVGHGTHVAGIAASRYPWDAIVDLDVLPSTGGLNSIVLALEAVENELVAKEKSGKPYTYIVNASLFFMAPVAKKIAGKVSESMAKDYNSLAIQISEKIQALHKKYPRFQFVASAGNSNAADASFYPAAIPGVRSIAAQSPYDFRIYDNTNFGDNTRISAPGVNIPSASSVGGPYAQRNATGTSMASPAAAADQAVIMALMPSITARKAVEILEAIAIPVDQFPVLQGARPIAAPASSLDLRSLLQYIEKNDLTGAVIPAALPLMRQLDAAWLDNIPVVADNNVINSIPNYNGKINFNANDQVEFTFTANAGKGAGNGIFRFTLGTVYVPPIGVSSFIDQPVMPGTYFTSPTAIPISKDGVDHTFKVTATRIISGAPWSKQQSVQIVVSKQVRPGVWEPVQSFTTTSAPAANDKLDIADLKLGVSRTADVTVKALSPLAKFGATQPTLPPSAAVTTSTTKSPTKPITSSPTQKPTPKSTPYPTPKAKQVTETPTKQPTVPINLTTTYPTKAVTAAPTKQATTANPTKKPTTRPTPKAVTPTPEPTKPTTTQYPTKTTTTRPTPKAVTPEPTKPKTDAPTKPATQTPTKPTGVKKTKPPTPFPTKPPTTAYPTRLPTLAPTRAKLEVGDCQLINIEPPIQDYTFVLKVEEKRVVFKKGLVEVQDKNGKVIVARNLAGLTINPKVISSLDKGTRYMFQISNNDGKFSISYVPLKKVQIRGTKKFEYKADGAIQQAVSWSNTKALDVSMIGIDPANIKADNAHGCDPVTGRRMLRTEPYKLPNPEADFDPAAPNEISSPSNMFFSAMASAAAAATEKIASQYLPSVTDTYPTDNSNEEPSLMQMVTKGLPLAAAAMTFLGLASYAAYKYYSKNDQEQDLEANVTERQVETVTVPVETANEMLTALLQPSPNKKFTA